MKLKNKKTGEIREVADVIIENMNKNGSTLNAISIDEIRKEWEDYEEPKEYWYIDYDGGILCGESDNSSAEKMMISMGNHFSSIEEAEKAVEKLKALKRLKDKGFRFNCCSIEHYVKQPRGIIGFEIDDYDKELCKDLDLLFGGE